MSEQTPESMVLTREKRRNAGARMADLLNKEDCDDFYQSTYGGFFDEEGDDAYQSPVESESDYVDSDFDIDENEKVVEGDADEDNEEETGKPKKSAKAYKEPGYRQKPQPSAAVDTEPKAKKPSAQHEAVSVAPKRERIYSPPPEKKLRQSTLLKGEEYERRREERREKRARRKKYCRAAEYYEKPSQAELLREAKETEELNVKSLERFQQYELEKRKRHRLGKQRLIKGPSIRYVSLTMPSLLHNGGGSSASLPRSDSNASAAPAPNQNLPPTGLNKPMSRFYLGDEQSNSTSGPSTPSWDVDLASRSENDAFLAGNQRAKKTQLEPTPGKCARTFITFSDDATFDRFVPDSRKGAKPTIPKAQYCVVTALPAKYLDPLTKLPYANAEAFKIIRESYYKHIEEKGDKNEPAVATWLQSRRGGV